MKFKYLIPAGKTALEIINTRIIWQTHHPVERYARPGIVIGKRVVEHKIIAENSSRNTSRAYANPKKKPSM